MIRRIAVLGAGTMGHGIAHAAISSGYETHLYDVSHEALDQGRSSIETILGKAVDLGKISGAQADVALRRLTTTTSLARGFGQPKAAKADGAILISLRRRNRRRNIIMTAVPARNASCSSN